MPIEINDFENSDAEELTELSNPEKVVRFLAANDDHAWTGSEIADETGIKTGSIYTVLSRLVDRNLIRKKGDYYALGDRERVSQAYDLHRSMEGMNEQYGEEDPDEWYPDDEDE